MMPQLDVTSDRNDSKHSGGLCFIIALSISQQQEVLIWCLMLILPYCIGTLLLQQLLWGSGAAGLEPCKTTRYAGGALFIRRSLYHPSSQADQPPIGVETKAAVSLQGKG